MAKPNRNTAEAFYDVFFDFPYEEQKIALRIMQEMHRQAERVEKSRKPAPPPPDLLEECGA